MTPELVRRVAARGVFILALALIWVLTMQLRSARAQYADLAQRYREPHAGMYLPTVVAPDLAAHLVLLGDSTRGARQLVFVFTTECPYCRASLPAWRRLAAEAEAMRSPRVRVVGVTLSAPDSTRAYAAEHRLTFPIVRFPEHKLVYIYRSQTVPVTMVIDAPGRVVYAHVGQLTDTLVEDSVLAALRMRSSASDSAVSRKE